MPGLPLAVAVAMNDAGRIKELKKELEECRNTPFIDHNTKDRSYEQLLELFKPSDCVLL